MSTLPPKPMRAESSPLTERRARESAAHSQASAARRRGFVCLGYAALGLGGTVAIHFGYMSQAWHDVLRGWGMHFVALFGSVAMTAWLLGYHRAEPRHAGRLLAIALWVPLGITLLHEAGQSIWPARDWEGWDSARDALLNVLGALLAWWLLPVTVGPGSAPARPVPRR
jgi:hypothetical protein